MEQVLGSAFGDSSRIWNIPMPIRRFVSGTGGGFGQNFRDVAFSIASSIFILNLASTARSLPTNLFNFLLRRLKSWFHQEIKITIPEFARDFSPGDNMYFPEEGSPNFRTDSKLFSAAETYIGTIATSNSSSLRTTLLRAGTDRSGRNIVLTIDDSQVITDTFLKDNRPILIKWRLHSKQVHKGNPSQSGDYQKKKYFMLTFNGRQTGVEVVKEYLKHVMNTSKKIMSQNRQLKLYTNKSNMGMPMGGHGMWDMIKFNHPSTFETFAMDPRKKKEIMDDLEAFSKSQDYYAKIGKAWKRGYLLYGPPGTGKSTMIACIANYLKYNVYDLELTAVMDNTHLRQLMVNVPSKSIIVIEDIDCSLDLTGSRKPVSSEDGEEEARANIENHLPWKNGRSPYKGKDSKVTLSGLLNFIDGLWSTCGGERLVVFTTNHIDKLDPALIRKGRMDVQIELSYCKFEAFKVLAKNYLGVDEHSLYDRVEELLEEVEITPADVAEQLLPKNIMAEGKASESLEELITKMEKIRDEREEGKQNN